MTRGPVVRRAVVPAAGRGTRMRALRGETPKELLPVGGVPMLLHGLVDLVRSGIREIAVVVAPDKREIADYLRRRLEQPRPEDPAGAWWPRLREVELHFAEQAEPRGLADAVACAEAFLGTEPFVLYLPDNVFVGRRAATAQVVETFAQVGDTTLALTRVDAATAARYGNCGNVTTAVVSGDTVRIVAIRDKGAGAFDASDALGWRGCGLSVCTSEFLAINRVLEPNAKGEWDDVPIYQRLAQEGRLFGRRLDSACHDAGNPTGYAAAELAHPALPTPK